MDLRRRDLEPDPLRQFERWYLEAGAVADVPERTALATADESGAPSLRMVLLKGFDERGLVFFTHYASRKGRELAANPRAALLLYWERLGRQVRVEGDVERVRAEESDAYFASRPAAARAGAIASRQSEVLERRALLEARVAEAERGPLERPDGWGGFRVRPRAWEFWQHRDDRLHDRFRYRRGGGGVSGGGVSGGGVSGGWISERLYP